MIRYKRKIEENKKIKDRYLSQFEDYPEAYKYKKEFIDKAVVVSERDVRKVFDVECKKNHCEQNAFNYAKENNMQIVIGVAIEKRHYIDHWWVYNPYTKEHLEVTPLGSNFMGYRIGEIIPKRNLDKSTSLNNFYK